MHRRLEQSHEWPYPHVASRSQSLSTTPSPVVATRNGPLNASGVHYGDWPPPLSLDRPFPPPTQEQLVQPQHNSNQQVDHDTRDDEFWALAASQDPTAEHELSSRVSAGLSRDSSDQRLGSGSDAMGGTSDEDEVIWQLAASQDVPMRDSACHDLLSGNDSLGEEAWAIAASQDPNSGPGVGQDSSALGAVLEVDMLDDFDDDWWAVAADQAALLELACTPVSAQSQVPDALPVLGPISGAAADDDDFEMDDNAASHSTPSHLRKLRHVNTPSSQAGSQIIQLSAAAAAASAAISGPDTPLKSPTAASTDPPPAAVPDLASERDTDSSLAQFPAQSASSSARILIRLKPTTILPTSSTSAVPVRGTKRKGKAKRKLWERLPRISPTDLSSAAWCEVQWLFMRTYGRDVKLLQSIGCKVDERVTKRLAVGSDIHAKLELELHDRVQVKTQTYEDRMALKILETVFCLNELVTKGITRELRVAGVLTYKATSTRLYLSGIVDQLEIQPIPPAPLTPSTASSSATAGEADTPTPRSQIVLSDNKTRRTRSLPTRAQTRTTWIQLATYHRLLKDLFAGTFPPESHLQALDALGDQSLSDELVNYVRGSPSLLGLMHEFAPNLDKGNLTLRQILAAQHAIATTLFADVTIATKVQVHYLDQKTGDKFATVDLELNEQEYGVWLDDFLGMVVGKRDPKGVEDVEDAGLKCGHCEYAPACAWREDKNQELLKRHKGARASAAEPGSATATETAAAAAREAVSNP